MNKRLTKRALVLATVVGSSFFTGIYFERNITSTTNTENVISNLLCNFLDNPFKKLTQTVSAAVPAADAPPSKQTIISQRVSQIMKYGYPSLDNIRSYSDYVLSYDNRTRVARWVFEHLTPESVRHNDEVNRTTCEFTPDMSVHPYFRALNTDYKLSGYDRGHLAAAGNHKLCQKHCHDTFYLTNMAPQIGRGFNRDSWNRLERYVRKLTKIYPNIYVCTGPLYLPQKDSNGKMYVKYEVIGSNTVAVPTHFFKIALGVTSDNKFELESYVMPNQVIDDNTPLNVFQVPIETIERASGFLIFNAIPKNSFHKINGKKC